MNKPILTPTALHLMSSPTHWEKQLVQQEAYIKSLGNSKADWRRWSEVLMSAINRKDYIIEMLNSTLGV